MNSAVARHFQLLVSTRNYCPPQEQRPRKKNQINLRPEFDNVRSDGSIPYQSSVFCSCRLASPNASEAATISRGGNSSNCVWHSAIFRRTSTHSCRARALFALSFSVSPEAQLIVNVRESSSLGQTTAPARCSCKTKPCVDNFITLFGKRALTSTYWTLLLYLPSGRCIADEIWWCCIFCVIITNVVAKRARLSIYCEPSILPA